MVHEVQNILKIGDLHQRPHWKVYHGTNIKAQQVYCSSEEVMQTQESVTWESSRPLLETYLNLAGEGVYTIQFKMKPSDTTGLLQNVFRITSENSPAAIAGTQNKPEAMGMPPMFWMQQLMSNHTMLMEAKIGKVQADLTAEFEKQKLQGEIDSLKKKLKEKSEGTTSISEIFKEVKNGFFEFKALRDSQIKPAIAISGIDANNIPGTEKEEEEQHEEKQPFVLRVTTPEIAQMYNDTMQDLVKMWGSSDELVINLRCLSILMKEEKSMYDAFILPRLKVIREKLNGVETTTGN